MAEQRAINAREREEWRARDVAQSPLAALQLDLPSRQLQIAALELVRAKDDVAVQHLMLDAQQQTRYLLAADDDAGVGVVVDQLAAVGAIMLQYEQHAEVERVVRCLSAIYSMPLETVEDRVFGLSTRIDPAQVAPRVFLQVIQRVYALGSLAVRLEQWQTMRMLSLQLPNRVDDYYTSWLRHALTELRPA